MSSAVYDCILGGLTVRQVRSVRMSINNRVRVGRLSGAIDPNSFFLQDQSKRAIIESFDVAGIVAGLTSLQAGLAISAGTITLPFNVRQNGAGFTSGSAHDTISGTDALVVPRFFSASQSDPAVAQLEVIFISSDGDTDPAAINHGQALAAQAFGAEYRLGPVEIGGTAIGEVERVTINPGLEVVTRMHDGFAYPTKVFIVRRNPFIDVTFRTLASLTLFADGFDGTAVFEAYFRKNTAGGTYVSPASTEHIKWSFAAGCREAPEISVDDANGQATARLWGASLAYSAASALP